MRFAYADPPYVGQAKKLYGCDEINHEDLIGVLCEEFPDGWALSASSPNLKHILPLCPDNVRVMAWVKPFCVFKPNVNPAYAWEPVIVRGGRKRGRDIPTIRDWVSVNITLKKGLCGAKPLPFCEWLLGVFNVQKGDVLYDLFPGTGVMTEAARSAEIEVPDEDWRTFQERRGAAGEAPQEMLCSRDIRAHGANARSRAPTGRGPLRRRSRGCAQRGEHRDGRLVLRSRQAGRLDNARGRARVRREAESEREMKDAESQRVGKRQGLHPVPILPTLQQAD